jgi:hypothetical protein
MAKNQSGVELPSVTVKELEAVGINYTISPGDILELVAEQQIKKIKEEAEPLIAEFKELKQEYKVLVLDKIEAIEEELKVLAGENAKVRVIYLMASDFEQNSTPFDKSQRDVHPRAMMRMAGGFMLIDERGWGEHGMMEDRYRERPFSAQSLRLSCLQIQEDRERIYLETGGDYFDMFYGEKEDLVVLCTVAKAEKIDDTTTEQDGVTIIKEGFTNTTYSKHLRVSKKELGTLRKKIKDHQERREAFKQQYTHAKGYNFIDVRDMIKKATNSINRKLLQSQSPELVEKLKTIFGLKEL